VSEADLWRDLFWHEARVLNRAMLRICELATQLTSLGVPTDAGIPGGVSTPAPADGQGV
jgi:hypothetical protein